jgi:hypothetical protein
VVLELGHSEPMTQVESLYIAASTNRHPHAADVSSSLVCFASHKLITLWNTLVSQPFFFLADISYISKDPSDSGVFLALPGHQAEVNCVKFMQNENMIASGDQKGVLQIRMKKSTKVTDHLTREILISDDTTTFEVENCD